MTTENRIIYYWISWDNYDGTEGECTCGTRREANEMYNSLRVPFKKMVACSTDREVTIYSEKRPEV